MTTIKQKLIKTAIERKQQIELSRNDPNVFREYVIKDDRTGLPIIQNNIHKSWIKHIQHCKNIGKHCAILAPWGHGKSIQIAIAETLWIIGPNPALRVKIVNSSDTYATDRVKAIRTYIQFDKEYKQVFPGIERDIDQEWTNHRIYLKRKGHAIDPTIEARGIMSTGVGGRADVIIFDDPVDEKSINSQLIRDNIRQQYKVAWMPRLVDDGFVYYICTRWHEDDLTKTIIESKRFSVLIQRISEDFEYIEEEVIE